MIKNCLLIAMVITLVIGGSAFAQQCVKPITSTEDGRNYLTIETDGSGNPSTYPLLDYYGPNLGIGHPGECRGCEVDNVPCPKGSQGQNPVSDHFDFDGEKWVDFDLAPYVGHEPGTDEAGNLMPAYIKTYGYCEQDLEEKEEPVDPFKRFLFDICLCPEACVVAAGQKISIQMMIDADGNFETQDDGVYFTDTELDKLYFGYYGFRLGDDQYVVQGEDPCQRPEMSMPDGLDNTEDPNNPGSLLSTTRAFKNIKYYKGYTEDKISRKGFYDLSMSGETARQDLPGLGEKSLSGPILSRSRAVALESVIQRQADGTFSGGYTFTNNEDRNCVLWIDIPAMRIDPFQVDTKNLKGNTVRLRIRVLFNVTDPSICPECNPPDYCEVILDVAKICCDDEGPKEGAGCAFFPYVLQGSNPWSSGVAITAKQALPANAYCDLTLMDANGLEETYRAGVTNSIWTFMIDDMMPNFSSAFANGAMSLQVKSNYSLDGYSFLTDGTFGAGTLSRDCCGLPYCTGN
ncbi:hypothetical protein QUF80_05165 [Desulfococcaceae bacterium HSG8]|nr:hypothetical protein [Desulfococcaceae bacterium HSG8]